MKKWKLIFMEKTRTTLYKLAAAVLLLAGILPVSAQELAFTLEEARAYAVEHSYFTQKALLDEEIAAKRVKETMAIGFPQINAQADFKNNMILPTSLVPDFTRPGSGEYIEMTFGTDYNISGGIRLDQLIVDGSYIVGLEAAKTFKLFNEQIRMKSERDIQNEVTNAYANVLIAEENYKTLKGNKEMLEKTLEETRALYEAGFVEEQDVDQLTILTQEAENQLNRAERFLDITRNILKYQMGIENTKTIVLKDSLDDIIDYGKELSVLRQKFDVNANIDYKISLTDQVLKGQNLKLKKMEYVPKLYGFIQYQQAYQWNDLSLNSNYWFPSSNWGIMLQIPVFSSFRRKYTVQQAKLNFEKSQINLQQVEQGLMVEYLTARAQYEYALGKYENNKKNLELVKRIVDKETIKYNTGTSSSLNLANAQIQFFQIQGGYIQSILQLIEARATLDKVLNNYPVKN